MQQMASKIECLSYVSTAIMQRKEKEKNELMLNNLAYFHHWKKKKKHISNQLFYTNLNKL